MTASESPAVARRRVRLALRRARERKGFTQAQVAEALDWSLSKVNRIESGEVTVSTTDLRAALAYLEVTDQSRVTQLVEDAKLSRRRGWWADPRYREHLTAGTLQLVQFESEATAIRAFTNALVPGLLQTPGYADFILRDVAPGDLHDDEDVAIRFEFRMRRRRQFFSRPDPAEFYLILDESVLNREIGGTEVSVDQFKDLLTMIEEPSVHVRIVPFASAAPIALMGPFTILDLEDEHDAVLYRESYLLDEILHSAQQIRRHRAIFEELWDRSFTERQTAGLIEARVAGMRAT